jgi:hypothetical protein
MNASFSRFPAKKAAPKSIRQRNSAFRAKAGALDLAVCPQRTILPAESIVFARQPLGPLLGALA